jgi:predicted AlkP superfamily pyrophosphatase or phosphodiesterase
MGIINKPEYRGNSLVNLMSSIIIASGGKARYPQLKKLTAKTIQKYNNILLIIIDGMGYDFLKKYGKGSFLESNAKGAITSVFPPTTAASITSIITGTAPQQHAVTSWYMHLKEVGSTVAVLQNSPRFGFVPLDLFDFDMKDIIDTAPFRKKVSYECYNIIPDYFKSSSYNSDSKDERMPYSSYLGFIRQTAKAVRKKTIKKNKKKLIYSYWPKYDSLAHHLGYNSSEAIEHFHELDKSFERISESLKGTDTLMIITSDHGFMNAKEVIFLHQHPKLMECLSQSLVGEPRSPNFYVHVDKKKEFESYMKIFRKKGTLKTRKQMIEEEWYGLYKPHPKLMHRIGDYTFLCGEGIIFRDHLANSEPNFDLGNHGGISRGEIFIPLIIKEIL